jgi:hypothetical protein
VNSYFGESHAIVLVPYSTVRGRLSFNGDATPVTLQVLYSKRCQGQGRAETNVCNIHASACTSHVHLIDKHPGETDKEEALDTVL